MKEAKLLERLAQEDFLQKKPAGQNSIQELGPSLLSLFGLDLEHPTQPADLDRGYVQATAVLRDVCDNFTNPARLIEIAPFTYGYLGAKTFQQALTVAKARAKSHPQEEAILDEIFTATTLLKPSDRPAFLKTVETASRLDHPVLGLDYLLAQADPRLTYTSTAEFPPEFKAADVVKATQMLRQLLTLGLFEPGTGFNTEYARVLSQMKSFDYLLESPDENLLLVVGKDLRKTPKLLLGDQEAYEFTPSIAARPHNNGRYPGIVLLTTGATPEEVGKFYQHATPLYLALTQKDKETILAALPTAQQELMIDGTAVADEDNLRSLLTNHLSFIRQHRPQAATPDFGSLLQAEQDRAAQFLKEGNEKFFDLREVFNSLGRRACIDQLVKEGGYKLPRRVDFRYALLVTDNSNLVDEFKSVLKRAYGNGLRIETHQQLLPLEETNLPFVLITTQSLSAQQLQQCYPSGTVIYVAKNDKTRAQLEAANPEAFILDFPESGGKAYSSEYLLAHWVVNSLFGRIMAERKKGVTDMTTIAHQISTEIKDRRDQILFDRGFRDYDRGIEYYNLQQQFSHLPLMLQLTDGVLMDACPTGGCLRMDLPSRGGCGGGNIPEVFVNFAIAYRKQVGEERFLGELRKFHGGKIREPWYLDRGEYRRAFRNGLTAKPAAPADEMVF